MLSLSNSISEDVRARISERLASGWNYMTSRPGSEHQNRQPNDQTKNSKRASAYILSRNSCIETRQIRAFPNTGVHGSGTCAGNADDFDRLVLKHSVEHAPSEGSVRAAPLQSQCNLAGRRR